jgi:hypothetical protein
MGRRKGYKNAKSPICDTSGLVPSTLPRYLVATSVVCIVVACALGQWFDPKGFWINAAAGLFWWAFAVPLGSLLIDRAVRRYHAQQWAKVKHFTCRAIANHLCDALMDAYIFLSPKDQSRMSDIIDGRNRPNPATPGAIQHLTEQLRARRPSNNEKSEDDIAMEYCEQVHHDFEQILEVLFPRVVQTANSQALVDALVELDQSWRDVQNAIIVQKRIVAGGVYDDVITLGEKAGKVYRALLAEWKV